MIAPSSAERESADYGAYPQNYEEVVQVWIRSNYFDPHSIQDVSMTAPEKWFIQQPPLLGSKRMFGYRVRLTANGKNRFGAYTGLKTTNLLIRNGEVIHQWDDGEMFGA